MPQLCTYLCNTSETTSCTHFCSTHTEPKWNFQMILTFTCLYVLQCVCVFLIPTFNHHFLPKNALGCNCYIILLTCKCAHQGFWSSRTYCSRLNKQGLTPECVWSPTLLELFHFLIFSANFMTWAATMEHQAEWWRFGHVHDITHRSYPVFVPAQTCA